MIVRGESGCLSSIFTASGERSEEGESVVSLVQVGPRYKFRFNTSTKAADQSVNGGKKDYMTCPHILLATYRQIDIK